MLYYVDNHRGNIKHITVPKSLRNRILAETHSGPCAGHFAGHKLYNVLVWNWYWKGMYDAIRAVLSVQPLQVVVVVNL